MMTSGRAAASIAACSLRLRSMRSGALSWMKSAFAPSSSIVLTKRRRPIAAPGFRPTRVRAGQALATLSLIAFSAPGAGSLAMTSSPWARQRAAQPLPITPPPTMPTVLMGDDPGVGIRVCSWSGWIAAAGTRQLIASPQAEFLARLGRRQRPRAHELDDLDGLLHELAVGGEDALLEEQVVLEPNAHVAAEQNCLRHHRHLHAADAEPGPMAVWG